jgi:cytochrome b561
MVQSSAGAIGLLIGTLYVGFLALMISGWIYLLMKMSEISRNVGVIAAQQEQHSRSLTSLADSVAVLARNSAAPTAVPPVAPEP